MRAIAIDPRLQRVTDIELSDTDMLSDMRRIIGCETMGHQIISDARDAIWCDDLVLSRGEPCFGFKLGRRDNHLILAGTCIIIGADPAGETRPPQIPIAMIINDIDWLGEIVPEVTWVEGAPNGRRVFGVLAGFTAVVTYKRAVRQ